MLCNLWVGYGNTTTDVNDACEALFTSIPDSNFENALFNLGYDDNPNDGKVPTLFITTIQNLDVSNQSISDLTGIQDFGGLQTLNVSGNNLTNINLNNLTQLIELNANDNQLNVLQLTNNTTLERLFADNNNLSQVDIPSVMTLREISLNDNNLSMLLLAGNTNLEILRVANNLFTDVDIASLANLKTLDVSGNSLDSITLSSLTNLEDLNIANNQFTSIDVSFNTALINFDAQGNQLTTIDVTTNTALETIQLSNNSLTTANLRNGNNTNITSVDLTGNSGLTCVFVDDAAYSTANWTTIDAQTEFTSTNYCGYTAIPDANFEAALSMYDDIPNDGQVPTELIEVLTNLSVTGENIASLAGIEDFTALESLSFDFNSVSSIDLSQNTTLQSLTCRNNNLTALDVSANTNLIDLVATDNPLGTIDVSANVLLERLRLSNSNLSSIDVSNNTAIEILDLAFNQITSLDLSANTNLEEVYVRDNALTFLNIQNGTNTTITTFNAVNNPNLSCILVDDAAYSTTNWTFIDATTSFSDIYCRYTAIPDSNFEAALEALGYDDISGDGQVPTALIETRTSLNVQALSIADLTGIEDFTLLRSLRVTNNALTTIDLSQNTDLNFLWCDQNSLTSLDLSNNTDIGFVAASQNSITSFDATGLTQLSTLSLWNNQLTSIDVTDATSLRNFDITNNSISTLDISNNTAIEEFKATNNSITALDISASTALTRFEIRNNNLSSLDLSNNPALTVIDVRNNDLTSLNVQNGNNTNIVAFRASSNSNLTCILVDDAVYSTTNWTTIDNQTTFSDTYCEYTAIPDANFEAALEALGYDDITADGQVPTALIETVTSLNVSSNAITDMTGIEDFAALTTLFCSQNVMTSLDVSNNIFLEEVYCQNNDNLATINVTGLTALKILRANECALTSIDITTNSNLEEISIRDNLITSFDVTNNTKLREIDCGENVGLGNVDFSTNVDLEVLEFSTAPALTSLDLSNNSALVELDIFNTSLSYLNLKNGNNTNMDGVDFSAANNPNLTCILVDDATYSTTNWTDIDVTTSFSDTYCVYTAIPDSNFEAYLESLGYDDITADGQVPTALIEGLTSLQISSGNNISDITGIEAFTALETLNVNQNNITAINVDANTALTTLIIDQVPVTSVSINNNPLLEDILILDTGTTIANLDLTNSPLLKDIDITNAGLQSITLPELPALEIFFLPNNGLTASIDLSASTVLQRVALQGNNLLDFNIQNGNNTNLLSIFLTNNPNLACVLVDDVAYSTTNWPNIDATTNFSDTYCRYTAIPDPVFEAALDNQGYDDIAADGQVPTALIETINGLDLEFTNVSDLTGIEDFTNLETIILTNASVTSVDFSNNMNLAFISLNDNTNLTSINVNGLVGLETVFLFNNDLTSIDFSTNTNLEIIRLQNNTNLTALDLTQNPLLLELNVSNCGLTSLNVQNGNNTNITSFDATGNANLTCILVDDVAYSTTNWTNIDSQAFFSSTYCVYTAIPDANFEAALSAYDDIPNDGQVPTELIENVTTLLLFNQSISDLTGIEDFTALEVLNAFSNNISSVDLSNNSLLRIVNLDNNGLSIVNLGTNTNLEFLLLQQNNLTTIDLTGFTSLQTLRLGFNPLTSLDLSTLSSLEIFTSSNCNLVDVNIQNGNNTSITSFSLVNNPDLFCVLVDDAAYSTTNWTAIDAQTSFSNTYCRYTAIPDTNFEAALQTLGYDDISADGQVPTALIEVVTTLDISNLSISDLTGIEDFAVLTNLQANDNLFATVDLSANTALEILNLSDCPLTILDVSSLVNLSELSLVNNSLTTLDLSANTALTSLISTGNSIVSYDLRNNTALSNLIIVSPLTEFINFKNGNNTNISTHAFYGATSLCIAVDDAAYAIANWGNAQSTDIYTEGYCRYTQIPDTNFEARLDELGYDDMPFDGQVPTILIENITSLTAVEEGITDVTGIEDFKALTSLTLKENDFTTIDLSQNTLLQSIDLEETATVTSINIAGLTQLTNLNFNQTSLSSIDLSDAVLLEELDVSVTDLTSLDISNNTELRELFVGFSQITSLDVSNNSLLTKVSITGTNIETLDLSNCSNLVEFSAVFADSLTFLNMQNGNNTNVTTFRTNNADLLSCVLVDDATYSTANWTQIEPITTFSDTYCRYTAIPDSNFESELFDQGYDDIENDGQVPTALIENLTLLDVGGQSIADATGIEAFVSLERLIIESNDFTSIDLSNLTQLKELDISECPLNSLDLSANTLLEDLFLEGTIGFTVLDISNNTLLENLSVEDCGITDITFTMLNNLLFFSVPRNNLTSVDASSFGQLASIDVSFNNLTEVNIQNGNNGNLETIDFTNNPNLTCILVDDAANANANWQSYKDAGASYSDTSCGNNFDVAIRVFLQGPALNPNTGEEDLMRDDLRVAGYIPTTSPYTDGITCEATVFDVTGDNAIVDWIWIELRDSTDNTIVSYSQSALIQRDGDVVDVDGISPLDFSTADDSYYVAIKHRNHLGIMGKNIYTFTIGVTNSVNFKFFNESVLFGSNPQTDFGIEAAEVYAMWCGNVNQDTVVQYSGTSPDTPDILSEVLNDAGNFLNFPTYSVTGYNINDANMDSVIQYSGTNPDTPFILQNVLAHPGNFLNFSTYQIIEQLPENFID
jgi:Leucine-rich repeat (LRR) protein